ncbi:hypothetical protein SDC9_199593 [bioreactor metagenome]|uniref:Uncharacterized protein n=1 Tax=bioreactor metagenome TaxID=1076179 RepID=A0A645IM73_9ZZZZ
MHGRQDLETAEVHRGDPAAVHGGQGSGVSVRQIPGGRYRVVAGNEVHRRGDGDRFGAGHRLLEVADRGGQPDSDLGQRVHLAARRRQGGSHRVRPRTGPRRVQDLRDAGDFDAVVQQRDQSRRGVPDLARTAESAGPDRGT